MARKLRIFGRALLLTTCMAAMSGHVLGQGFARETQANIDAGLAGGRATDVAEELREKRSSMEPAPWSPRTEDIGEQLILKERDDYKTFAAFADGSFYATDNVALTSAGEQDDAYFVGQLGLSARPRIGRSLFGEVTVRQQFFRYDEFDGLDFDGFDAGGGLTYITEKLTGLAFFTRYNYKRLTDAEENNEFFVAHTLKIGVQKPYVLSRAHFLYAALSADFNLHTEPSFSGRHEYALDIGYNVNLTRSIEAQLYYRLGYYDYTDFSRDDWNHIFGVSASYSLTEWFSVNAFGTYALNRSNFGVFDYDAGNIGGGLAVKVLF